jgi:endonuclease YncB( thermonuclease family)
MFRLLIFAIGAIASFVHCPPVLSDPITVSGIPGITDGDTLRIGNTRIRIFGIDAPEKHQTCATIDGKSYSCGEEATKALAHLIDGHSINCVVEDTDRYGRSVAICEVKGNDIGYALVAAGWAVAYRKYSLRYVPVEDQAKAAKVGMWGGQFEMPWQWRKAH